jgi:GNAT superfamily N-acetyltransferase
MSILKINQSIKIVQANKRQDICLAHEVLKEVNSWLALKKIPLWTEDEISIDKMLHYLESETLYLVFQNKNIVGVFCYEIEDQIFWADYPGGEAAFIHRLAIKRNFSSQGISQYIINWAIAKTKKDGFKYLRLDCLSDRKKLCVLYESMGFLRVEDIQVDCLSIPSARYQINTIQFQP